MAFVHRIFAEDGKWYAKGSVDLGDENTSYFCMWDSDGKHVNYAPLDIVLPETKEETKQGDTSNVFDYFKHKFERQWRARLDPPESNT